MSTAGESAGNGTAPLGRALLLAGISAAWWVTCWRLVTLPEPQLVSNLLVDDALYFAQPARNLVAGNGFSFDGVELTNGVQTLWAAVCVGLAWLFSDATAMVRAMLTVNALCWFAAGVGLYLWLRRASWPAAVFAMSGFLWSGVQQRVAFQGMENSLHALVSVWVLFAGARAVRERWTTTATLGLGAALACFGLSRTEAVVLGPIVAAPMLAGWLGVPGTFARRLRAVAWLAAPGVVVVGGAMLASRLVFDCWLPISGSVKQLYEQQWGRWDGHGGFFACAGWHLNLVFKLVLGPLREQVPDLLSDVTGLRYRHFRNAVWALLAVGVVVAVRRRPPIGGAFVAVFCGYALLHLILMGVTLPHFAGYAIWYFASEATATWLLLGALGTVARGRARYVPLVLAVLMAPAGMRTAEGLGGDVRTNVFRQAGIWLREHTAPGTTIGALSSGWVAWYADRQHVVNLDGLINNRRYLDDFLRPGRVGDYFEDRGITWFADYQTCRAWRRGLSWQGRVPAARMVPRRYWRLRDDEAYVVWQVLPDGAAFEVLGDGGPPVRDRFVELAVAADVHERFDVVGDDEVAGRVVARSMVVLPDLDLRHVVMSREQLSAVALTAATVHPDRALAVPVVDGVRLIGCDSVRSDDAVAVTLFWSCEEPPATMPALALESDGGARVAVGDCRGTLPMPSWPAARCVVETYVLDGGDVRLVAPAGAVELTR